MCVHWYILLHTCQQGQLMAFPLPKHPGSQRVHNRCFEPGDRPFRSGTLDPCLLLSIGRTKGWTRCDSRRRGRPRRASAAMAMFARRPTLRGVVFDMVRTNRKLDLAGDRRIADGGADEWLGRLRTAP